jgi:hypothetical protein
MIRKELAKINSEFGKTSKSTAQSPIPSKSEKCARLKSSYFLGRISREKPSNKG